jgi:hypothetical protein
MNPSKRAFTTLAILGTTFASSLLLVPQDVRAQNMLLQIQGDKRQMYDQFMSIYEQQKKRSSHRIEAQINDIKNACELSDSQLKKLSVAAKGAVEAHGKEIATQLRTAATNVARFEFDPGNPPVEEKKSSDEEDEEEGVVIARGGQLVSMQATTKGSVETTKIWESSLRKTLTAEQLEKLEKWNEDRRSRIQQAAIAQYVSKIDLKLFFSPDQVPKVTSWIDEKIGPQLVEQLNGSQRPRQIFIMGNQVQPKLQKIDVELASLLTKPQQEIWKESFQAEFNDIRKIVMKAPVRLAPAFKKKRAN